MNPARIGYAMRCDIFDALPYIHAGAGMRGAADKSHPALTRSTQFGAFQHVLAQLHSEEAHDPTKPAAAHRSVLRLDSLPIADEAVGTIDDPVLSSLLHNNPPFTVRDYSGKYASAGKPTYRFSVMVSVRWRSRSS